MTAECSAESADGGGVHDFGTTCDSGDRHATSERFRRQDQVGLNAEMFGREPFAGAREAGLHFVGDEEDAVLAANRMQGFEITARRDDEAPFAQNWFGDYGGDGFGSDVALECVFEMMREGFDGRFAIGAI